MSRDSSGESLEAILASIRRSLAEQTTSVLQEEAVVPAELLPPADGIADLDAPPIPASLSQRLALAPDARGAPIGLGEEAARMAEDPLTAAATVVPQARDSSLPPAQPWCRPQRRSPRPDQKAGQTLASFRHPTAMQLRQLRQGSLPSRRRGRRIRFGS